MTINTYVIVERAVYEGAALGISRALQPSDPPTTPDQFLDIVHKSVMNELSLIIDFNQQEVPTTKEFDQLIELTKQTNQQ
ncbi:MAG: hypothetical protein EBU46_13695 [Nitrosomonadaceae bacterium]|nr:hypothetical protein [Nitrosomonadaceae bacterium]